jgi:hypothetical protein
MRCSPINQSHVWQKKKWIPVNIGVGLGRRGGGGGAEWHLAVRHASHALKLPNMQSKFGRWVCGGNQSHVWQKKKWIPVNIGVGLGRRGGGGGGAEWHLAFKHASHALKLRAVQSKFWRWGRGGNWSHMRPNKMRITVNLGAGLGGGYQGGSTSRTVMVGDLEADETSQLPGGDARQPHQPRQRGTHLSATPAQQQVPVGTTVGLRANKIGRVLVLQADQHHQPHGEALDGTGQLPGGDARQPHQPRQRGTHLSATPAQQQGPVGTTVGLRANKIGRVLVLQADQHHQPHGEVLHFVPSGAGRKADLKIDHFAFLTRKKN